MEDFMRNEKKVIYLTRCIEELKKENLTLKQENQALSAQLKKNKTSILLRQQALDEKEKQIDATKKTYERIINELKKRKDNYEKATKIAKKSKKIYEAETSVLLKRLRKQNQ